MLKIKTLFIPNEYVSEIGQLIIAFDKEHPKLSASQRKEQKKYARIYALRDTAKRKEPKEKGWENF